MFCEAVRSYEETSLNMSSSDPHALWPICHSQLQLKVSHIPLYPTKCLYACELWQKRRYRKQSFIWSDRYRKQSFIGPGLLHTKPCWYKPDAVADLCQAAGRSRVGDSRFPEWVQMHLNWCSMSFKGIVWLIFGFASFQYTRLQGNDDVRRSHVISLSTGILMMTCSLPLLHHVEKYAEEWFKKSKDVKTLNATRWRPAWCGTSTSTFRSSPPLHREWQRISHGDPAHMRFSRVL